MRRANCCLFLAALASLAGISVRSQPSPASSESYTNSAAYRRSMWAAQRRTWPLGYVPLDARSEALKQLGVATQRPLDGGGGPQNFWVNIGPAPVLGGQIGASSGLRPMSGRIKTIAVDPGNTNHWLVGAAGGGVWETLDAGTNWSPKTDSQATLAMGALAFAPSQSNVIYAGTGTSGFSSECEAGAGLLKSTNGGATWQLLAQTNLANLAFCRVRVDNTNANSLTAALTRAFFGVNGEYPPALPARGIYKSSDGGVTWSLRLNGEATALEPVPGNFQRQYAGIGEIFGNAGNGVYRSTNGGVTWQTISGPWQTATGGVGRVELAVAPSDPNTVYVSVQDAFGSGGHDGGLLGLWRTADAWSASPAWANISVAATDDGSGVLGYCGWDPAYLNATYACWVTHILTVAPDNPNVLYAGGVPLWKYDGSIWTEVSKTKSDPAHGMKVDQQAFAWAGNRLLVGNDGGVWSSTDGGTNWNDHNTTLCTVQYYAGALHPTQPVFALGGSQDQGTTRWGDSNAWPLLFGGDGGCCAISATHPNQQWALTTQDLQIWRTLAAGGSLTAADAGIDKTGAPFISRLVKSPANDDLMLAGTDNLWKCTNFFTAATPTWATNGPEMGAGISAIAFAPSDLTSHIYAFGVANGQVRLTTDGGSTWSDPDPANTLPNRYVTGLAFHPTNANILYATLSGFDQGTPAQPGHLFVSTNVLTGSPTWANISPPFNYPHNCIALDPAHPNVIYAGTDLGLWMSTNSGAGWAHVGPAQGLPYVAVYDVQVSPGAGRTVAFTHGRGAYALVDGSYLGQIVITSFHVATGGVELAFTTDLNQSYRVEGASSLTTGAWSNLVDHVLGTGGIFTTNAPRQYSPAEFYRVRKL